LNPAALQFFPAMTLKRLGRLLEASEALKNGRDAFKSPMPADAPSRDPSRNWSERVYTALLEREATKLIEGK
jgi:hypothetical protein